MALIGAGTFLLFAVVGGAIFAGLDVRKKKKPVEGGGEARGEPPPSTDDLPILSCAVTIAEAKGGLSVGGGPLVPVGVVEEDLAVIASSGQPIVLLTFCQPADPMLIQVLEAVCAERPDIDFYATYPWMQEDLECGTMIVLATVMTSLEEGLVGIYAFMHIPELVLNEGGDIAEWIGHIVNFVEGAHHDNVILKEVG